MSCALQLIVRDLLHISYARGRLCSRSSQSCIQFGESRTPLIQLIAPLRPARHSRRLGVGATGMFESTAAHPFTIRRHRDDSLRRGGTTRRLKVLSEDHVAEEQRDQDRKSTRLNSSHVAISYAVFCSKSNS